MLLLPQGSLSAESFILSIFIALFHSDGKKEMHVFFVRKWEVTNIKKLSYNILKYLIFNNIYKE